MSESAPNNAPHYQLARFIAGPEFAIGDTTWVLADPPKPCVLVQKIDGPPVGHSHVFQSVDAIVYPDGSVQPTVAAADAVELLPEFTTDPPVSLFLIGEIEQAYREHRLPVPVAVVHLDGSPFTPVGETLQ